jgi:hypothetical protein
MLRATPQLRATPPVFWNCRFEAASPALLGILPNAQMRMYLDTYMRAALTRGARHAYWHLRLWCRVWYVLAPCKSACAVSGVDPCVTQAFVSAAKVDRVQLNFVYGHANHASEDMQTQARLVLP